MRNNQYHTYLVHKWFGKRIKHAGDLSELK